MRRSGKVLGRLTIGMAVVASLVGGGWWVMKLARPVVNVTEVAEGPVVHAFYATGTISPDPQIYPVRSNVAGVLIEVRAERGQHVKAGHVVAIIASDELQFKLKQAEADLKEKLLRADEKTSPVLRELDAKVAAFQEIQRLIQREVDRFTQLLQTRAASQQDLDQAQQRLKTAWSEVEAFKAQRDAKKLELDRDADVAQAAVDIARWNADQQRIKSPIDGVVVDWPVRQGTRVAINDPVMQVADIRPDHLVMRAQVDEEDKTRVLPGQVVRMTLYSFPAVTFTGRVKTIYTRADPERRTFEVDVQLSDQTFFRRLARLIPGSDWSMPVAPLELGMTGELAFEVDSRARAMVIPSQAVQNGTVWVVRDGRIAKAAVVIGLQSVERVEVISGLGRGERVLISPIGDLREGQDVRTNWVDPITAAGLNKPKVDASRFKGFQG